MNSEHMGSDGPTDVLSFPVDGAAPDSTLVGDVLVCPQVAARTGLRLMQGPLWTSADCWSCTALCTYAAGTTPTRSNVGEMWARERELMNGLERATEPGSVDGMTSDRHLAADHHHPAGASSPPCWPSPRPRSPA